LTDGPVAGWAAPLRRNGDGFRRRRRPAPSARNRRVPSCERNAALCLRIRSTFMSGYRARPAGEGRVRRAARKVPFLLEDSEPPAAFSARVKKKKPAGVFVPRDRPTLPSRGEEDPRQDGRTCRRPSPGCAAATFLNQRRPDSRSSRGYQRSWNNRREPALRRASSGRTQLRSVFVARQSPSSERSVLTKADCRAPAREEKVRRQDVAAPRGRSEDRVSSVLSAAAGMDGPARGPDRVSALALG